MPLNPILSILPEVTPHPLVPWYTEAEALEILNQPDGAETLAALAAERELHILRSWNLDKGDPLYHGFDLPHWADADRLLAERIKFLILLGGNRSAKSEYCAKRFVRALVDNPGCNLLVLSENFEAARETVMPLIWKYLPRKFKNLNGKKDSKKIHFVSYSEKNGFGDNILVLPHRGKIHFKTYQQEAGDVEGWEFGVPGKLIPGIWADENLRISWLKMADRRLRYHPAQLLWSFTPVNGMTPTIKEAVGKAKTLESRPAELLPPDQIHVPDCPPGHMPYIQKPALGAARVIYFFSAYNLFGPTLSGPAYYEGVRELCAGKPNEFIMKMAHGYTTDTVGRAFVNFSEVHIVTPEQLPAEGTNYQYVDPAGGRNFATIWVRVSTDNPPRYYVYRDWPDRQTYGEWAVPTERATTESSKKGWDGDPGPAQRSLGYGIVDYKQTWKTVETIDPSVPQRDPHREQLRLQATTGETADPADTIREVIRKRVMDSRAFANPHVDEHGGTNLARDFAKEQQDSAGNVIGERVQFRQASGVKVEQGIPAVNELLRYDKRQPLDVVMNYPRLFVSEECQQFIWALTNYTGLGGSDGACKDFADLARYMALDKPRHITKAMLRVTGGRTPR